MTATTRTAKDYATLVDVVSRMNPDGSLAPIAEILNEEAPILQFLKFKECNMTEGHKHTVRTGLPSVTWRRMYKGVQPSKSQTASAVDTTGNVEAYGETDKDVADLNGNTAAFRLSEESAFIEAMAQDMSETVWYGDVTKNPDRFTGIAPRYSSTKAKNARNLKLCETTGTNLTSAYFLTFTEKTLSGIYPKGSKAGLAVTDKGQVTLQDEDGNPFEGYRTHYKWQAGVTLTDWRGCSRVANIDVDKLLDGESEYYKTNKLLHALMDGKNALKPKWRKQARMFVSQEVANALEKIGVEKSNNAVKLVEAAGQMTTYFFGIPVEVDDSISLKETLVK